MQVTLATLGYVLSPDRRLVLLVHRDARPGDHHFGRYNGLGGKLEPGEDLAAGMRREIQEEAGLRCRRLELAGTICWPGFGPDGADWFAGVFRITSWTGSPPARNAEGELVWTPVADLVAGQVRTWPGDRFFLPLVFAVSPRQFHGVLPYAGGTPLGWSYSEL
jgi:8-oxo-dGTP diphosphatase